MDIDSRTIVTTTDYLSGFQYAGAVLQVFSTAEGYVRYKDGTYNYIFNYTDNSGNIRVSYARDPANPAQLKIIEENHYYPYGLKHENYNIEKLEYLPAPGGMVLAGASALQYKYKYNGIEYQDELGLNLYDMDFRDYDPAVGRWLMELFNQIKFLLDLDNIKLASNSSRSVY
jgi:RHS repeat-associated protein